MNYIQLLQYQIAPSNWTEKAYNLETGFRNTGIIMFSKLYSIEHLWIYTKPPANAKHITYTP